MSKITQLNEKAIAVEEHGEVIECSIVPMTSAGTHSGTGLRIRIKTSHAIRYKSLPPGSWSILGRPEEIAEEEWKGIVERQRGETGLFKDYELKGSLAKYGTFLLPNAKYSGLSLLKSKNINPEKDSVIILIKQ